jgi:hypothetical protein
MTVENVTVQTWQQKVVNFSVVRWGFSWELEPLYNRLFEQYSGKLDFLNLMVDDPQNKEVLLHASVEGTRLRWSSIAEQEKLASMLDILLSLY